MDKDIKQIEEIEKSEPIREVPKKHSLVGVHLISGIIILVLIIGSTVGAYFWRDNQASVFEKTQADELLVKQQTILELQAQLADYTGEVTNSPTLCSEIAPTASAIESIKASITSGNTVALEGYMASNVNVILAATEAYGMQTASHAVSSVTTFISDDINSWDYNFSLPTATINSYKQSGYAQYFSSTSIVGLAPNNQLISFSFDCLGDIDTVFMASQADTL